MTKRKLKATAAATERESLSLGLCLSLLAGWSESPRLLVYSTPPPPPPLLHEHSIIIISRVNGVQPTSYQAAKASIQSVIHSMEIQFIECTRYYRHIVVGLSCVYFNYRVTRCFWLVVSMVVEKIAVLLLFSLQDGTGLDWTRRQPQPSFLAWDCVYLCGGIFL